MAESTNNPVGSGSNPSGVPQGNDAGAKARDVAVTPPASIPAPEVFSVPKAIDQMTKIANGYEKLFEDFRKSQTERTAAEKAHSASIQKKARAEAWYADQLKKAGDAGLSQDDILAHAAAMKKLDERVKRTESDLKQAGSAMEKLEGELSSSEKEFKKLHKSVTDAGDTFDDYYGERFEIASLVMTEAMDKTAKYGEDTAVNLRGLALATAQQNEKMKELEAVEQQMIAVKEDLANEELAGVRAVTQEELDLLQARSDALKKSSGISDKQLAEIRLKLDRESSNKKAAEERKKREEEFQDRKRIARELAKEQAKIAKEGESERSFEALKQLGITHAATIKAAADEVAARKMALWRLSEEGAAKLRNAKTEEEREKILSEKRLEIMSKNEEEITKVALKKHDEMVEEEKRKKIEAIASKEGVSITTATKMASTDKDFQNFSYEQSRTRQDLVSSLKKSYEGDEETRKETFKHYDRVKESQVKALEDAQEARYTRPVWVSSLESVLGTGFGDVVTKLVDLKKTSGGWLKFLLIGIAFIVGGIVAYFVSYFKMVVGILSKIPKVGDLIASTGGAIGKIFGGAGGFFGKLFGPLTGIFARLGGFLNSMFPIIGKLVSAFRMGFGVVSKFFIPLQIVISLIDGVIGAFKGFKKDGLKGLIAGFFANIISGLTFGLVKFDSVYAVFKKVVDVFSFVLGKMWEGFKKAFDNFNTYFLSPILGLLKKVAGLIGGVVEILVKSFQLIGAVIATGFGYVTDFVGEIIGSITEGLSYLYEEWIQPLIEWISETIIKPIQEWMMWIYDNGIKPVIDYANSVLDNMGKGIDAVKEYLDGALGWWLGNDDEEEETNIEKAIDAQTPSLVSAPKPGQMVSVLSSPEGEMVPIIAGGDTISSTIMSAGGGRTSQMILSTDSVASQQILSQTNSISSDRMRIQQEGMKPNVIVNAPKTAVSAGGGGGDGPMFFSQKTSRNNDPTYRALMFMEAPAM